MFFKKGVGKMQKFMLLTSILVLSACGGGSGGSSANSTTPPTNPEIPTGTIWQEPTVSEDVANSNKQITSMRSAISNSTKVVAYVEEQLESFIETASVSQPTSLNTTNRAAFTWMAPSTGNNLSKDEQALEISKLSEWLLLDTTTEEDIVAVFNHDKQKLHKAMHVLSKGNNPCFIGGSATETAACFKNTWVQNNSSAIEEFESNGKLETFNLNDIDFKMIEGNKTETFEIVVNENGKITGLHFRDKNRERIGDSNDFDFVEMLGPDDAKVEVQAKLSYESHGKNIGTSGLKYADFGLLRFNSEQPGFEFEEIMPYAGGYEAKRIDKSDIENTVTFNGHAIGQAGNTELADDSATLVFDKASGDETFSASFDNWYDINVVKNDTGTTFTFTGDAKDGPTLSTPTISTPGGTNGDIEIIGFETAYYGDSKSPSEATALFNYSQDVNGLGGENADYTHVNISFGGKAE